MSKSATGLVGCLGLIAIMLAVSALLAWGAQYVLAAFGIHVSFWVCFVGLIVLRSIFMAATRVGKSS